MPNNLLLPISRASSSKCAAQHFGMWAIEPRWFGSAMDAIRSGAMKPVEPVAMDDEDYDDEEPPTPYQMIDNVAVVRLDGPMTKRGSSYGGCSTVNVRSSLRTAANDPAVRGIVLYVDSPGGTVGGTVDLADDVKTAGQIKPVVAYIADTGCSAAYWVASQCRTIFAGRTAFVGSIGIYAELIDDTASQEKVGIKYRIVSTGPYKGLGADGAVTDQLVADVQREVDDVNQHFLAAITTGRGGRLPDIKAVTDGRAWIASEAKQLGLIDEIASFDAVVSGLSKEVKIMTREEFLAYGKANPDDAKQFHDAGFSAGKAAGLADGAKAEQTRFNALTEKYGKDRSGFVVEQFAKGNDVAKASVDLADLLLAENAQLKEQVAAKVKADPNAKTQTVQAERRAQQPIAEDFDDVAEQPKHAASGRAAASGAIARMSGKRRKPEDTK